MNAKVFNLALMVIWLAILVGLLTRDWWMPPELHDRVSGPKTPMVIAVAGMLAVWNFMRYFISNRFSGPPKLSPTAEAYRKRIRGMSAEDPKVTDPQFRFDDPPKDSAPQPGER
jgi:hypothetical protein